MMTKEELRAFSRPALPKSEVGVWSAQQLKVRAEFAKLAELLPEQLVKSVRRKKNKT